MKKLLMGAMATAMAATAFGGQIQDDLLAKEQLVITPVNATVMVGTGTPTTSIEVTGDLNFGNITANAGSNPNETAPRKILNVFKVSKMNGSETGRTELGVGEYAFKLADKTKTWDDVKDRAKTTQADSNPGIFMLEGGDGSLVSIGSGSFAYAGRAQALEDGLNVWFSGDIASENNGKTYNVGANVFVTFAENIQQ